MRTATAALAGLALLALLALPAATAKGILEDSSRYPAGVTGVTRTWVAPGEEFSVLVNTDGRYDRAAMVICRFLKESDPEPNVCWSQIGATAAEGGIFTADSSGGAHPRWEDGWTIGYKFSLEGPGGDASVPATGGEYYKVLVRPMGDEAVGGATSRAAPFCSVCVGAIGLAAVARRRLAD